MIFAQIAAEEPAATDLSKLSCQSDCHIFTIHT